MKPMFINIEVKTALNLRDPCIQLGTWIAAEFEKRTFEKYPMDMSVIAISVLEDNWKMYLLYAMPIPKVAGKRDYRVRFMGPVDMDSTEDFEGVFKILHCMITVMKRGLEVYKPWFETKILAKYP